MKKYFIVLLLLLVGCGNVENTANNIEPKNNIVALEQDDLSMENYEVKVENLILLMNEFTKDVRVAGDETELQAIEFIERTMNELGYELTSQDFPFYRKDIKYYSTLELNPYNEEPIGYSSNLIFTNGNYDMNKKDLIISAHYDTTNQTIGVIDNGTGVVSLLELANIFKDKELPFNLKFIFFGCEEYGLSGSKHYVSNLSENEINNILGVLNIDMVAEIGDKNLVFKTMQGFPNILTEINNTNSAEQVKIDIGASSDEYPFYLKMIPAITISQDGGSESFNMENDLELLDVEKLRETIMFVEGYINNFDLSIYERLVEDTKQINPYENEISNLKTSYLDISNIEYKNYLLNNLYFELTEGNGYASILNAEYVNNDNNIFIVKSIHKPNNFIDISEYQLVYSNDNNKYYCYYDIDNKIFVIDERFYTTIIYSDFTENECIEIAQQLYNFN